jgi:hypothetical protein
VDLVAAFQTPGYRNPDTARTVGSREKSISGSIEGGEDSRLVHIVQVGFSWKDLWIEFVGF